MLERIYQVYLLPGIVFQGVVIGGGYGTGREIVEYFVQYGAAGGLMAMLCITLPIWVVTLALSFEFARLFHTYDYRSLLIQLLGRFWVSFEIFYVLLLIIILAVVGSASGTLLKSYFDVPYLAGVSVLFLSIAFLTFKGSEMIEGFFAIWAIALYVVYALFCVVSVSEFGEQIRNVMNSSGAEKGWQLSGIKYGFYNMVVVPAVLFATRHIQTRQEALVSSVVAALLGLLPGLVFLVAILGLYPDVVGAEIPVVYVLERASAPVLLSVFAVVLFGTLIQTGVGFIHGVNQRIHDTLASRGKVFPQWGRPLVAIGFLLASLLLSTFGIINLVAQGYSLISWGVVLVYFVPLVTVGLYKIAVSA